MAEKEKDDKIAWWGKPSHLKREEEVRQGKRRAPQERRKTTRKRTTRPKAPLTKMGVALRTMKHALYMLLIIVAGAVGAHYILTSITRHDVRCTVPQLESLSMAEAQELVAKDELHLIINDSLYAYDYKGGVILDQLPKAGAVVKPGRSIYLTVNATQLRIVDVPYVAERSLRQAKNILDLSGLTIGRLIYEDDLARNYILKQYVGEKQITGKSEERATIGTEVTLHVGRGSDDVTLAPMLLGLSLRDAQSLLWGSGLNVGELEYDGDVDLRNRMQARIYSQSVRANSDSHFGEDVALSLSSNQQKVDSMIVVYYKEVELEQKLLQLVEELMAMEVLPIEELEQKTVEELEVLKTMAIEMKEMELSGNAEEREDETTEE